MNAPAERRLAVSQAGKQARQPGQYPRNFGRGFLYGDPCGEPARGGPCVRSLGHGGRHHASKRHLTDAEEGWA